MDNGKSTFERIRTAIDDMLGCGEEKITLDSHLENDLDMDSLDAVEVLMRVEDDFGVMLDEVDLETVKTVKDFVEVVDRTKD